MGILSSLLKRRRQARVDIKAATAKARAEVKASAKDLRRRQNMLAKHEKQLLKMEQKGLKDQRKHERQVAKAEYQKLKNGRFNAATMQRYVKAAQVVVPVLLPLAYRAITQLKDSSTQAKARRAGVTPTQLAEFTGHGASLQARIQGIRNSLDSAQLSTGFRRDISDHLDELRKAVDNAEFMTPEQRRRSHSAISSDIDSVTAQIQRHFQGK